MTNSNKPGDRSWTHLVREELSKEAGQSPARIELERRRLLAKISSENSSRSGALVSPIAIFAWASAAAVLLVLGLFVFSPKERTPETILVSGLWRVSSQDPLARGSRLRVPADNGAKVVLNDGTALWLASSSEAEAEDPEFSKVVLNKGRLLAAVAKRAEPDQFRLKTPNGDILVHGTVFSVHTSKNETFVRLYEGEIQVETGQGATQVSPGHQVRVSGGAVVSMTRIDKAAVIADLMITEKTADLDGPPVPQIGVPDEEQNRPEAFTEQPEAAIARDESKNKKKPKNKKVKRRRAIVSSGDPVIEDTDTIEDKPEFVDPELEGIEVEYEQDASPDEDDLFDRAYQELRAGNHKEARELMQKYVEAYPRARYWQHIKNILSD